MMLRSVAWWLVIFLLLRQTLEIKECPEGLEFEPECRFSILRHSCWSYNRLGANETSEYYVDVTGRGGNNTVTCNFRVENVVTALKHDIKNPLILRSWEVGNVNVEVSYEDFNSSNLKIFLDSQKQCAQKIKFKCRNAQLNWGKEIWFQTVSANGSMGKHEKSKCSCEDNEDCTEILKENRVPLVSLRSTHAPTNDPKSFAHLHLYTMHCIIKDYRENEITLRTSSSFLKLTEPWYEKDFIFNFKTLDDQGIIFYQENENTNLIIYIEAANSLGVKICIGGKFYIATFSFSERLSNGDWHLVYIEAVGDEMRIVVDSMKKFLRLPASFNIYSFKNTMEAWLGHQSKSFSGCIKDLEINGKYNLIETAFNTSNKKDILWKCNLKCFNCIKGAKCEEIFNDAYKCHCSFPSVDNTRNCKGKSEVVYFENPSSNIWFVGKKFENSKRGNIFQSSFGFTFLTNTEKANLFTAVDQNFNIIQVVLMNPNLIILMFNKLEEIISLSVNTKPHALNEGQPVRIEVNRKPTNLEICVITRGQKFNKIHNSALPPLLTNQDTNPFEIVPLGLVDITNKLEHTKIFLGAVVDEYIKSEMTGFIGCFRNFITDYRGTTINKKYQLKISNIGIDEWKVASVILNKCNSSCEYDGTYCENGGFCTQQMNSIGDPTVRCNCSGNSYIGQFCNSDISYHFNGKSAFSSEDAEYKIKYEIERFMKFAFSVDRKSNIYSGILLKVTFQEIDREDKVYGFYIDATYNLIIHYLVIGKSYRKLSIKLDDTIVRHTVICHFSNEQYIKVDKKKYIEGDFQSATETNLFNPDSLTLMVGGSTFHQKETFLGCISNIVIKTDRVPIKEPLKDYRNDSSKFKTINGPLLYKNMCKIDSAIRGSDISISTWMKKKEFQKQKEVEEKKTHFFSEAWPYFLVFGIILVIIPLIAIFVYRKYIERREERKRAERKKKSKLVQLNTVDESKVKSIDKGKTVEKREVKSLDKEKNVEKKDIKPLDKGKNVENKDIKPLDKGKKDIKSLDKGKNVDKKKVKSEDKKAAKPEKQIEDPLRARLKQKK